MVDRSNPTTFHNLISSRRGKFNLLPSQFTLIVNWIKHSFKIHVVSSLEIFKNVKLLDKWQQSVFCIKFGLRCIFGNNRNIKFKVARTIILVKKLIRRHFWSNNGESDLTISLFFRKSKSSKTFLYSDIGALRLIKRLKKEA